MEVSVKDRSLRVTIFGHGDAPILSLRGFALSKYPSFFLGGGAQYNWESREIMSWKPSVSAPRVLPLTIHEKGHPEDPETRELTPGVGP
jgi:hypothetical protein